MPRTRWRKPRIIAPRLSSGESRESVGHGLPPNIKQAIRMIAARENKSLSWVLEKVIIQAFHLRQPEYVERKEHEEEKPERERQWANARTASGRR